MEVSNKEEIVVAWWSGGITSAVACRLAVEKYQNIELVYIETGSHHEDTIRFKTECEKWYGHKIKTIQNKRYKSHFDVISQTKYINGPIGARCTKELKKNARFDFEKTNKVAAQVWGYEFEINQINRAIRMQEQYPDIAHLFPLIENKLSKNECAGILNRAGIEIPIMYKLGYNNNNCIGCVKGGAGYWNKIRVDFPQVFKQMAEAERYTNATCLKDKNGKIYLDELDHNAGNKNDLIVDEGGIFCQIDFAHIMSKKTTDILNGKLSIYE